MKFLTTIFKLFVFIQTIGFKSAVLAIKGYQNIGIGRAIIAMICAIILMLLAIFIDFCILYGICLLVQSICIAIRTKKINRCRVTGTVTEKILQITNGFTEYNLYVSYNGVERKFDRKDLFNKHKIGDTISVELVERLDKKNKIIKRTLELLE